MNQLLEHISMKHLMVLSAGMLVLGFLWILTVWITGIDNIWLVPGGFLVVSGITKMIAVQVWIKVAKLGTDEHKPIKAL